MVSWKGLEVKHHGVAEVEIFSVVLHLLVEDVTGVDNARYVLHTDIFGLLEFIKYIFPEVEVFDTF